MTRLRQDNTQRGIRQGVSEVVYGVEARRANCRSYRRFVRPDQRRVMATRVISAKADEVRHVRRCCRVRILRRCRMVVVGGAPDPRWQRIWWLLPQALATCVFGRSSLTAEMMEYGRPSVRRRRGGHS
ncbi:MAG: hypothetical protein ACLT98_01925 [Eggerthellaceae bacterium]